MGSGIKHDSFTVSLPVARGDVCVCVPVQYILHAKKIVCGFESELISFRVSEILASIGLVVGSFLALSIVFLTFGFS